MRATGDSSRLMNTGISGLAGAGLSLLLAVVLCACGGGAPTAESIMAKANQATGSTCTPRHDTIGFGCGSLDVVMLGKGMTPYQWAVSADVSCWISGDTWVITGGFDNGANLAKAVGGTFENPLGKCK